MSHTKLAGTFWSEINTDQLVSHLFKARALLEDQTRSDLQTFVTCAARETTPLYRRLLLAPLTLHRADSRDQLTWAAPAGLADVAVVTDRITDPRLVLLKNIDFTLGGGCITFRRTPLGAAGAPDGTAVTLWLTDADYDENYLNDLWGAPLGLSAPASDAYREVLCTAYAALIGGTSRAHVERLMALYTGTRVARTTETVETITRDETGPLVITDKNIYRPATPDRRPRVTAGQTITPGTPIFDALGFYRPGDVPFDRVAAVTVPGRALDPRVGGDLTFYNTDVPVVTTAAGVTFEVGGAEPVVARFWALFNAQQDAAGVTGADLLRAAAGTGTINPLKFVFQHVLTANVLCCVTEDRAPPADPVHTDWPKLFRAIVPVGELVVNLTVNPDRVTVS